MYRIVIQQNDVIGSFVWNMNNLFRCPNSSLAKVYSLYIYVYLRTEVLILGLACVLIARVLHVSHFGTCINSNVETNLS